MSGSPPGERRRARKKQVHPAFGSRSGGVRVRASRRRARVGRDAIPRRGRPFIAPATANAALLVLAATAGACGLQGKKAEGERIIGSIKVAKSSATAVGTF